MSNLGGILAKELFKFLLTEVFKIVHICTMILRTVKNTVEIKQAYLFYIRHVQVTPTDNSASCFQIDIPLSIHYCVRLIDW